jgi:hypothetical protein
MAKGGSVWQGQASLGKGDWEAARASFKRALSRMNFRLGDPANGNIIEPLIGLAFAEKKLGIDSWTEHAASLQYYIESMLEKTVNFGSWPADNGNYLLAQIAAIQGDLDRVVMHLEAARDQNDLVHQFFANDPYFAEFRDEPRLISIAEETRKRAQAEHRKLEPKPTAAPT